MTVLNVSHPFNHYEKELWVDGFGSKFGPFFFTLAFIWYMYSVQPTQAYPGFFESVSFRFLSFLFFLIYNTLAIRKVSRNWRFLSYKWYFLFDDESHWRVIEYVLG